MSRKKTSVATLVIAILVTIATLLLATLGVLNYRHERNTQLAALRADTKTAADQLAAGLALPLWNFDKAQIDKILDSIMTNPDMHAVIIRQNDLTSPTGITIYARIRDAQWKPDTTEKELASADLISEERPIVTSDEQMGTLKLFSTSRFVNEGLSRSRYAVVTRILLLDALLIISLFFLLWRTVFRPLRVVEQYALAVSSGDFQDPAKAILPDRRFRGELENLRSSIEKMVASLQKHEAMLRTLVQACPAYFVAIDGDGRTIMMNDAMLRALGYNKQSVVGKDYLSTFVPESDRAEVAQVIEELLHSPESAVNTNRILASTGQTLLVEWHGRSIFTPEGAVDYLFGIGIDITQRQRAEDQVRTLNAQLEKRVLLRTSELESANKELEAFSYSVSHDLRAPLRAISGFSRIMMEDHLPTLDPEAARCLNVIDENARQMGALIDDLLAFSRLSRQPLNTENIPIQRIAQEVADQQRAAEPPERKIEITIGDLPSCMADASLIKQVLVNLISNALKYSRKREVAKIEIGFNAQPGDHCGAYFVRDNGAGFDMKYSGKLFGVFQRLHTAAEYEGTGVGLAIVKRIIDRHGGRVWVQAAPDQGATFYFTLSGEPR